MRVILKEDVAHVGNMGDIVKVSDGYGLNYLIPQGLAELATEDRAKAFAHQKAMIEHKKAKLHKEAEALQAKLEGIEIKIARTAVKDDRHSEQNTDEPQISRIHGSVTNRDIVDAIKAVANIDVDKRLVEVAQSIRELGDHDVTIKLAHDVVANIKVVVVAE